MAYDNPAGLIAMAVILEFLAITAVGMRFASRHKLRAGFQADDWCIVVALVLASALCFIEIFGVAKTALGIPLSAQIVDLLEFFERFDISRKLEMSFLTIGNLSLTFTKLSVVLLYRRIFNPNNQDWFGMISLMMSILIVLWGFTFTVAGLTQCGADINHLFGTYEDFLEYCGAAQPITVAMFLSDAIIDFLVLLLPVPMILRLHCSMSRKAVVGSILAVGLLSVGASCAKASIYMKYSLKDYKVNPIGLVTEVSVWHYVECMVGIIAACAVTFRPVLQSISSRAPFSRLLSSKGTNNDSSAPYGMSRKSATSSSQPPHKHAFHKSLASSGVQTFRSSVSAMSDVEKGGVRSPSPPPLCDMCHAEIERTGHITVKKTFTVYVDDDKDTDMTDVEHLREPETCSTCTSGSVRHPVLR